MKFKHIMFIILILLVGAIAISTISSYTPETEIVDGLNSTSNLTQALDNAKNENKVVMVLFDQETCYYCDLFKEDVLVNSEVQNKLNNDFILVCIDINKEGALAAEYQVFGTPTCVFLDENGNEIYKIEGYISANEFLDSIKEI